MKKVLINIALLLFFSCSAQKKQPNIERIQEVQVDTSVVEKILFPIRINDYDLEDEIAELKIVVNEKGLYQYKDSTLVNADTKIWLHKFPKIDKNKIPDCGESPISYGYLKGKIINGKKEGKWFKKVETPKRPDYAIVKMLHYKNGVLDGKYQIYNTDGMALHPSEPHPLYPDEYKDYEIFEDGTGWYYDYYYEIGILKTKGFYKNNIKDGEWIYYDKNGNDTHREYYKNGVLINQ